MSIRKHKKESWLPDFPECATQPVHMHEDDESSTIVTDRRISIQVNCDFIENPAIFWIDEDHVYCRANWAHWFSVSISAPEHFRLLSRVRQCTLHQMRLEAQESQECQVRVYHVNTLPDKLFSPGDRELNGEEKSLCGEQLRQVTIQQLKMEIEEFGLNELMGFDHIELPGVPPLDFIVASGRKNVLFAVHPPETDPGFETGWAYEPEEDDPRFDPISFRETIQRLVRQRKALQKFDGDVEVVLAVYDYPFMLERIRRFWQKELEAEGIELIEELGFGAFLRKQFGEEDGEP